ncbi:MAG: hypothetical protein P8I84_07025 [Paracoccaceae bacterium]|jgi:hypothetical protein|nr:hypothetical protein [Paracoccaceae bacterium]MDG1940138.1 hypothetical protein [Paracoccaceae bacterium]|tara:strand:- start:17188 stop:17532 length:345 start_codon:yes stop_codon:yes gene_type:complete
MIYDLPKEVMDGLKKARREDFSKKNRLRIMIEGTAFPILRYWETGFALDAKVAPALRGLIDIYNGSNHMAQCLIILSSVKGDERIFEFKRNTQAVDKVPIDFERQKNSPVALLQ